MFGLNRALDQLQRKCLDPIKHSIGASGTPAKFAGYKADFLGLGRGLFGLDRPSFTEINFITT